MVTTDQLMHSLDDDAFANAQLLKSENKLPLKEPNELFLHLGHYW